MTRIRSVALAITVAAAGAAACGPRQAQVSSAPSQPAQVSIQVRNTLTQAVNVYVNTGGGGSDTFLQQVAANSTATVPVPGVAPGATVTLRAVTLDGARTYTREKATLSGTFTFTLP